MAIGSNDPLTLTHWGAYRVATSEGKTVSAQPFELDPDPSHLGESLIDGWDSTSRILGPAVRRGYLESRGGGFGRRGTDPFVEVSWDRAIELVALETRQVIDSHGNHAIFGGSYGWSSAGRFHHAQSQVHRFLNTLGGYTSSVNTYSSAAADVILPHVVGYGSMQLEYGGMQPTWAEIAENASLVVSFGGIAMKNRQVAAGGPVRHLASAGVQALSEAGVRVINVGITAADGPPVNNLEHFWIRPCTDTALMLALAHTMITENLWDSEFVDRCTVGMERLVPYLLGVRDGCPKDAEWAGSVCDVDPQEIRLLARQMAESRCLITVALAVQRQQFGEQTWWAAVVLAALVGQIGLPGRGIGFGYGSFSPVGNAPPVPKWPSLPQGKNHVDSYIPVARIADMLLHPGDTIDYNGRRLTFPDIKLVWWAGGNPFHHHQDLNRLVRAWQRPETIIVQDIFWNATARHADIVLPATTSLERNDIGGAQLDPHLLAMKKVVEPLGRSRSDYEILRGIAEALDVDGAYTEGRDEMAWLRHLYGELGRTLGERGALLPSFDEFWDKGWLEVPFGPEAHAPFADLRADPEGHPLPTPSGRIEIYSEAVASFDYSDCPGHPTWLEPEEWPGAPVAGRYPLYLSSNQPATRLHSQYDHGIVSRSSKIGGREVVHISRADAVDRGITNNSLVRIYNDRGSCLAAAHLDDRVRPGVIQIPTGAWYYPVFVPGVGVIDSHGNPNVLTRDAGTSRLAQGPTVNAMVEIEPWSGDPPPLEPFTPPEIMTDQDGTVCHGRAGSS